MADAVNHTAHILIVDDEPVIRSMLGSILCESYECATADSAEEALAMLRTQTFDLIVSDINMKGMSGLEMIPQALAAAPDTVVMMVSGEQTIESAIEALRVGAFDYIRKPFDLQHVEAAVRRALERMKFVAYYQPRVDMNTGLVIGAEALVRRRHPDLGLVPPAEFIPLAEDAGLIVPLGERVLRTACEQGRSWQESGFAPLSAAVNLSARQFQQQNLSDVVARILRETGLDSHYLELELTESSITKDAESSVRTLGELKEMGVKIAIDDFGTGYSSLGYLKRLPIDMLKIDQSFVRLLRIRAVVPRPRGRRRRAAPRAPQRLRRLRPNLRRTD
jgi:EAL domain-containing protein (putative c-di-GMP-specific phosphodiesterase class I)